MKIPYDAPVRCQCGPCWSNATRRIAVGSRVVCVCEQHFEALNSSLVVRWPVIENEMEDKDGKSKTATTIPVRRA
jgi:hypothetical protein